jgi:hypothetical protein
MMVLDACLEVDTTTSLEAGHHIVIEPACRYRSAMGVQNLMTHIAPLPPLDSSHDHPLITAAL